MNNPTAEVDFREAMRMLDVPEEVLGKLSEERKLKSRPADGTIYFLREQIEQLVDLQSQEVRSVEFSADDPGEAKAL
jgi:hypothetical protein